VYRDVVNNPRLNVGVVSVSSSGSVVFGALANNGGPTPTLLPETGSLPLDAIPIASSQAPPATGITTDQRGVTRPQGAGCDVGTVEVAVATTTLTLTAAFTG